MSNRSIIGTCHIILFVIFCPFLAAAETTVEAGVKGESAKPKLEQWEQEIIPQEGVACSWSKMNSTEYKACQTKKSAASKASAAEKRRHNHALDLAPLPLPAKIR